MKLKILVVVKKVLLILKTLYTYTYLIKNNYTFVLSVA